MRGTNTSGRRLWTVTCALALLCVGCTDTWSFTPSTETLQATNRAVRLGDSRVMVLSPASFQQVAPELTNEAPGGNATAGQTAAGVLQTVDYNQVQQRVENALLDGGLQPIDESALTRAAVNSKFQAGIRSLRGSGELNLMAVALLLAHSANVPNLFLIRRILGRCPRVGYDNNGGATFAYFAPDVTIDAAWVDSASGAILWQGEIESKPADGVSPTHGPGAVFPLPRSYSDTDQEGNDRKADDPTACPPLISQQLNVAADHVAKSLLTHLSVSTPAPTAGGSAVSTPAPTPAPTAGASAVSAPAPTPSAVPAPSGATSAAH